MIHSSVRKKIHLGVQTELWFKGLGFGEFSWLFGARTKMMMEELTKARYA